MNWPSYQFIDLGSSKGGSINFVRSNLGLLRGVGIDRNPNKKFNPPSGCALVTGDVLTMDIPANSVKLVSMMDFLEHLPGLKDVKKCITIYSQVASDCIFIFGPYFDADEYLKSLGFKMFFSDWSGHTYHFTIKDFISICSELNLEHSVYLYKHLPTSEAEEILPISASRNSHEYNAEKMSYKDTSIKFTKPVYRGFYGLIKLKDTPITRYIEDMLKRSGYPKYE